MIESKKEVYGENFEKRTYTLENCWAIPLFEDCPDYVVNETATFVDEDTPIQFDGFLSTTCGGNFWAGNPPPPASDCDVIIFYPNPSVFYNNVVFRNTSALVAPFFPNAVSANVETQGPTYMVVGSSVNFFWSATVIGFTTDIGYTF